MSIVFQTSQSASANGLPKLQRLAAGFPANGLAGLYLFEDGVAGQPYSSTAKDSSGNGNDAILRSGRTVPIRQTSGLLVSAATGVVYDTPIPQSNDVTVIVVAKVTGFDGTTGQGVPAFVQNSLNIQASTASNSLTTKGVFLGVDENNASALHKFSCFTSSPATQHVLNATDFRNLSVAGLSFDHTLGRSRIAGSTVNAPFVDAAQVGRTMSADGGYFSFGITKYYAETRLTGEIHLVAIYSQLLSDADMDNVIAIAKARVAARGVAVS